MASTKSGDQKNGHATTGTHDEHYDLISALYHALEGASTFETYIKDAEKKKDEEIIAFFREVQSQYRNVAEQAKELLASRLMAAEPELAKSKK